MVVALASCAPVATQLVVVARTDAPPEQWRALALTAFREGDSRPIATHTLVFPGATLPASFGVVAARPDDARPVLVDAVLTLQDATGLGYVTQSARVSLRPGRVLQLDLALDRACLRRTPASSCPIGQRCSGAACVTIDRDALPELAP
jgi:hypothetical protein